VGRGDFSRPGIIHHFLYPKKGETMAVTGSEKGVLRIVERLGEVREETTDCRLTLR